MLDPDVDSLFDISVADLSVKNDADSGLGDVVDYSSLAVIDLCGRDKYVRMAIRAAITYSVSSYISYLVRHTLLHSTVRNHIHDVAHFVLLQVG